MGGEPSPHIHVPFYTSGLFWFLITGVSKLKLLAPIGPDILRSPWTQEPQLPLQFHWSKASTTLPVSFFDRSAHAC